MTDKGDVVGKVDEWASCYDLSYRGIIVDEAFCHPAKMSRGLLTRILRHAKEEEWLWPGAVIVDPFGGIFTTGLLGAYEGYQVVGVELESEFYRLANSYDCPGLTKAEWVRWFNRYRRNPDICPACHHKAQTWYEKHSGVIPSQEPHHFVGNIELHARKLAALGCPQPVIIQGDSRRLCELLQGADCVISSPPFQESLQSKDAEFHAKWCKEHGRDVTKPNYQGKIAGYGQTPGQLGAMRPGDVNLICSSPPYEGNPHAGESKNGFVYTGEHNYTGSRCSINRYDTNKSQDNLGNSQGDTFWAASRIILEQSYAILRPGGVAIWVVKDFVRNKKRVDFTGDWRRLCESVGFKTLHEHHAMLIKETEHQTFFGPETTIKEKKSFFRRLCESKGSPKIDFETIYCMCKPKG